MTLLITIPPKAEAILIRRAAAEGSDLATYAAHILEQAVSQPLLDELLEPLRAEFAASGASDQELIDQISEAREEEFLLRVSVSPCFKLTASIS